MLLRNTLDRMKTQITMTDVLAKCGFLAVENDKLKAYITELEKAIQELKDVSNSDETRQPGD